jgi:non-canonical poly(A) RNA polymerase PAPD5/7
MKPYRVRQICRSRNPFSPSIALWQHFVLPYHPLRQQRPLSTATETSPNSAPDADAETPSTATPAVTSEKAPESQSEQQNTPYRAVRKVIDSKGKRAFDSPKHASIQKNANLRAEKHVGKTEELLSKAKEAFDGSEDYDGVAVEAVAASRAVSEKLLPWCVRYPSGEEKKAEDRYSLCPWSIYCNC